MDDFFGFYTCKKRFLHKLYTNNVCVKSGFYTNLSCVEFVYLALQINRFTHSPCIGTILRLALNFYSQPKYIFGVALQAFNHNIARIHGQVSIFLVATYGG